MKKRKSAKDIFNGPTYSDVVSAQIAYDNAVHKLDLWKIGAIIALAGPIAVIILINVLPDSVEIGMPLMCVMFAIPAFISYALAGGIRYVLKIFGKLAEWGWLIAPIPIDIFVALIILFLGFFIMIYIPIGFVLLARRDLTKEKKAAETYLNYAAATQSPSDSTDANNAVVSPDSSNSGEATNSASTIPGTATVKSSNTLLIIIVCLIAVIIALVAFIIVSNNRKDTDKVSQPTDTETASSSSDIDSDTDTDSDSVVADSSSSDNTDDSNTCEDADDENDDEDDNNSDDASDEGSDVNLTGEDDSITPDFSSEVLSDDYIANLSDEDLQLEINTLYAVKGYHFKTSSIQDYFDSKSWYEDEGITDQNEIKDSLDSTELKNWEKLSDERDSRK